MTSPRRRLVPTGVAAAELGIDGSTLSRWRRAGIVRPAMVTAGRHARWDMEDLRRQIREWSDSERRVAEGDDEAPDQ